ncbi:MAG TPA: hypothetical protein PLH02_05095 [Bacillota bacterium]|nr:hypothetical protein [Bacillota bacterium]HPQ62224.1 hypothetical protein [Bacillota bacterium]
MTQSTWYQKREGNADHVVYLDKKANELQKMLNHQKTMIIRGATGKKVPLGGRVKQDDILYFVETGSDLFITHRALVKSVTETDKMTKEESIAFVEKYQKELMLDPHQKTRWAGKRFLCLVEIHQIEPIEPFQYRREKNMDDWIIVDDINDIKI